MTADNKVVQGNNLPCGLSPLEHVHLSVTASKVPQELPIDEELLHNIRWLFGQPSGAHEAAQLEELAHREMVDDFRSKAVSEWLAQAHRLRYATVAWVANSPIQISSAVQQWNGPLIDHLMQSSGHEDSLLVHLQQGFPMLGSIPAYGISSRPAAKTSDDGPTVNDVWANKERSNGELFRS